MSAPPDLSALLAEADRCVQCGLCLPHCPTYRLSMDEGESPRGRIHLIRGLAAGELAVDDAARRHLERCLGCRACEAMCPSKVRYGRLLDGAVGGVPQLRQGRLRHRVAGTLATPPRLRRWVRLLRLYQRSGLPRLLRRLLPPRLARLERLLPPLAAPHPLAPRPAPQGSPALFVGCLGETLDQATLAAALRLLERLGIEVALPAGQGCCGALAHHAGERNRAQRLAAANLEAFRGHGPILSLASGCGATLREYGELAGEAGAELGRRHESLPTFLARHWPEAVTLRPLAARVVVHEPCSQRNLLRDGEAVYTLLKRIPGLEVVPLPGNPACCGAGGDYLLRQAEIADALREPKLDALAELRPDYLVTTNPGCALHLAAGLREHGLEVPVLHPVTLLDSVL